MIQDDSRPTTGAVPSEAFDLPDCRPEPLPLSPPLSNPRPLDAAADASNGRRGPDSSGSTDPALTKPSATEILQAAIRERSTPDAAGCWRWKLSLSRDGYGKFHVGGGRRFTAQRASYMAFKGNIPDGHQIDHLCRVRCCVNPDHLEAVTPRENLMRSESKIAAQASQTHCSRGHELSGENLHVYEGDGHRRCKTCTALKSREHYLRNRQKIIARTAAREARIKAEAKTGGAH